MRTINSDKEYRAVVDRVEVLLKLVGNESSVNDQNFIELDLLSDLLADFEEANFPIAAPTLIEVLNLRMYEMGLNQVKLSQLLGVSPSRISEYLTGKSEPPLKIAREISKKLNISASVVLGV